MAALRVKRGLEASLLVRRVTASRASPFSAASWRSAASTASRTSLDKQRNLSGTASTTFEYKPVFQYDATPRDDPTEVCARDGASLDEPVLPGFCIIRNVAIYGVLDDRVLCCNLQFAVSQYTYILHTRRPLTTALYISKFLGAICDENTAVGGLAGLLRLHLSYMRYPQLIVHVAPAPKLS